jgi:polyisoprenoid-binding protein YceI
MTGKRSVFFFAVLLSVLNGVAALWAQESVLELDPANTKVEFTLADVLHTVHGGFALKSGTIRFTPATGAASGQIVVDVTSGVSGNQTRDRKMHKEILESQLYPEATFTPTKVSGNIAPQGNSTVRVDGIFRLHGAEHTVTLSFPVSVNGESMTAKTHMVIPYVAWGMKNPSTFILRVSDKVDLDITAAGRLTSVAEPADHRDK